MKTINLQQTDDDAAALTATVHDRVVVFAYDDELQLTFCLSKEALRKVVAEMDSEDDRTDDFCHFFPPLQEYEPSEER